tara:strand:+ start:26006 stop:26704 length:699 start_codon:yes stop_codon:yes gene_type:complete
MKSTSLNNINTFAPESRQDLIDYALKHKKILIAINAEKILHSTSQIRNIINHNLGYPDGIGAVWALQKKGFKNTLKIPGCELWLEIITKTYRDNTFYLVGGKQQVIEETVKKLKKEFTGIKILNYRNGYIENNQDKFDLINDVKTLKPDIIFVAIGSPKQELLMAEMQKSHPATYQGLGGSFDVYTSYINRAPKWFLDNNLEWAYRLIRQPLRIKRQIHLIRFFILLHLNKF